MNDIIFGIFQFSNSKSQSIYEQKLIFHIFLLEPLAMNELMALMRWLVELAQCLI